MAELEVSSRRTSEGERRLSLESTPDEDGSAGVAADASSASLMYKDGQCSICNTKLGKRHLTPRHHCRICSRAVCASCSPNSVLFGGMEKQRACTDCVAHIEKHPGFVGRVAQLGDRVAKLGGRDTAPAASPVNLEEAVAYCENAQTAAEQEHTKQAAQISKLDAEVRMARSGILRMTQRLQLMSRSRTVPLPESSDLSEVLAACEAALNRFQGLGNRSPRCTCCTAERYSLQTPSEDDVGIRMGQRTPLWASEAQVNLEGTSFTTPWRSKRAKRAFVALGCIVFVVILVVLALQFLVPHVVQSIINDATITLVDAAMSNPTETSVRMSSSVVLNNAGPISGRMSSFRANLGSEGRTFGWCVFPEVTTTASGPTNIDLDTELHVTDNAAFTAATVKILQGEAGVWDIDGTAELHVMGLTVQVQMKKTLQLPATLLKKVQAVNIDILSSTATELYATSDVSFFSSSVLEMHNFGPLTFALHPVRPDGSVVLDVELGHVAMSNFQVFRDVNEVSGSQIVLKKDPTSEPYLQQFVGDWVSGNAQLSAIRGPVESSSPFLNNITLQLVQIGGLPETVMKSGYISGARTIIGHVPETGEPCSLIGAEDCLKGAVIMVGNPLHHDLMLVDMTYDVFMPTPLSYDATFYEAFIPRTVSCNKGTRFARMNTVKGMWSYLNVSRNQDASVVVPAAPPGQKQALSSFLIPGNPQPGQGGGDPCFWLPQLDPQDCCFTSLMTAASCYYLNQDLSYIPVSLVGNATMHVGDFSLRVTVTQKSIPISFANDVAHLQVGPISLSCKDIVFH